MKVTEVFYSTKKNRYYVKEIPLANSADDSVMVLDNGYNQAIPKSLLNSIEGTQVKDHKTKKPIGTRWYFSSKERGLSFVENHFRDLESDDSCLIISLTK